MESFPCRIPKSRELSGNGGYESDGFVSKNDRHRASWRTPGEIVVRAGTRAKVAATKGLGMVAQFVNCNRIWESRMAWERRRNKLFYYRSYRDPATGRLRKQYVGTGPVAEDAARQDAARRAQKVAQRRDETAAEQRYEAAHRLLLALSQQCDTLTRAALAEAGYYQHHRGEWRPYGKKKGK